MPSHKEQKAQKRIPQSLKFKQSNGILMVNAKWWLKRQFSVMSADKKRKKE